MGSPMASQARASNFKLALALLGGDQVAYVNAEDKCEITIKAMSFVGDQAKKDQALRILYTDSTAYLNVYRSGNSEVKQLCLNILT